MTQTLCERCAVIDLASLRSRFQHYGSLDQLSRSAHTCTLCSLIIQSVILWTAPHSAQTKQILTSCSNQDEITALFLLALRQHKLDLDEPTKISLEYTRAASGVVIIRSAGKQVGSGRGIDVVAGRLRIFTVSNAGAATIDDIPTGRAITPLLDLALFSKLVEQWMEECQTTHFACHPQSSTEAPNHSPQQQQPTRVLDISQIHSSGTVKLCITTQGVRHRYVALSHRWGGSAPIKTLQSNYHQRLAGFRFSALPQTFQDACTVAFSLGIHYIWIDSLCIIQDSSDDWRREAAKMGDVYTHSTLTIAATAAQDSESGFLHPRHLSGHARIPMALNGGTPGDVLSLDLGNYRTAKDDIDECELNKRGWVLQERILSPCTLHFAHTHVYCECWSAQLREDGQVHRRQKTQTQMFPALLSATSPPPPPPPPSSSTLLQKQTEIETPKQWFPLLETYTATSLTFPSDKLIAISGLIQKLAAQTRQRYVKGLWEDKFHEGLLWVRSTSQSLEQIIPNSDNDNDTHVVVPTWSWASRNGAVGHVALDTQYAVNTELELSHRSQEGDGKASEDSLRLRASVHALSAECEIGMEASTIRPPQLLKYTAAVNKISVKGEYCGWVLFDQAESVDMKDLLWVICVVSFHGLDPSDESASEQDLEKKQRPFCLLVRRVGTDMYERVGVGCVYKYSYLCLVQKDVAIV